MLGSHERRRELAEIAEAMRRHRGCLLTGAAGVGKSAVATAAAAALEASHHVVHVRATVGSAELPLGAFLSIIGSRDRRPMSLVADTRQAIHELAAGRPVVLHVDDIDLLDDISTVLVHQLVSSGEATLLATYRMGRLLPAEIVGLRQTGDIAQVTVAELDRAGVASMAAQQIGRPLSDASVDRLASVTKGNALCIQVVIAGARDSGNLIETPDGAELLHLPFDSPAAVDMVRQRIGFLDDAQRAALTAVAFAEPCGLAEVASVADERMLAFLEQAELITCTVDGSRWVLHLAHPLFGEVIRASTPRLQRTRCLAALATDLAATGVRRGADAVRLARLGLDGGVAVPHHVTVEAIRRCHTSGDMFLAARLGRAEFDRSRDFSVGWDLAQSIAALGDPVEHDRVVDELRAIASTTGQRLTVAFQASQGEFWLKGDHETAMKVIDAALAENPDDGDPPGAVTRQDLLARRALMFAAAGRPGPARDELRAIGPPASGTAGLLMVITEAIASTIEGHPQRAYAALEQVRAVFARMGEQGTASWIRRLMANRIQAHGVAGDLDRWDEDSATLLTHAIDEQQLAFGYMLRAHSHALRGKPSLGRPLIEAAQRWWQISHGGGGLPRRYVLATAVHLYGTAEDVARCRAVLADYDADTHDSRLLDSYAEVGRARMLAADHRPEEARQSLRAAMDTFGDRGDRAGEMSCGYELVRLDRASEVAARLEAIAAASDSALFEIQAQHASGAATRDLDALERAANAFAERGFHLFAVSAIADAVAVARRGGNERRVAAVGQRLQDLRALCDDRMLTAAVPDTTIGPAALTRREREIAVLAAQGLGNREIAERLFISKRTAENHLARVYMKFGITSRVQLVRILDAPGLG